VSGVWCLAPGETDEERARRSALLERRWALIAAHRHRHLKLWFPFESEGGNHVATWTGAGEEYCEHSEAAEAALYDWLDEALGPGETAC
jgi:hypothetical protein